VKPTPKAVNKPLQHCLVHGLAKPGSSATVSQFIQYTNAFLLGAKLANSDVVITTVSTQTFNDTHPSLAVPAGIPLSAFNCQNPASDFPPSTGAPIDCLAINKMLAHDPQIDFVVNMKSSLLTQEYILDALTPDEANDYTLIENQLSYTMNASDLHAILDDERVAIATVYDFQPVLNRVADQFLAGQLVPGSLEYFQNIDNEPTVDVSRLSTRYNGEEQANVNHVIEKSIKEKPKSDPFCVDLVAVYLGSVYTLTDGCLSEHDQLTGTIFSPAIPAANRLRCIPQTNPTPNPYPVRCAP
jgi:hypothetical protein